jgi:hypothetical protein
MIPPQYVKPYVQRGKSELRTPTQFVNLAAWLVLTPKNHSTTGKRGLGVITRAGDGMLRTVLVAGATAVIADMRQRETRSCPGYKTSRKPPKLAAIALANKLARIAWKLMVSGERYRPASSVMPASVPGTVGQPEAVRSRFSFE